MSNEFDKLELQRLHGDYPICVLTGKQATAFHHAISRKYMYTNSLLNAIPVDNQYHLDNHGLISRRPQAVKMIVDNTRFLLQRGYKFCDIDYKFVLHHDLLEDIKGLLRN